MLLPNVTLNRELIAQLRREILEGDWDDSPWENIPESKVKATVDDITTTNCFNPAETDDVEQIRQEVMNDKSMASLGPILGGVLEEATLRFSVSVKETTIEVVPIGKLDIANSRRMKRIKKKQTKRRRSRIRSVRKCNISKMRSAFTRFTLFQRLVETDTMGGIGRYMKVIFGFQKLVGSYYWERTDLIPRGYWKFGSLPCTSKMCCWNVIKHCGFQSDH